MVCDGICFFCGSSAEKNNVKQKSIDTITAVSKKRNDDKWKLLEDMKYSALVFHPKCRADYINPKNVQSAVKRSVKCVPENDLPISPGRKRLKSSSLSFNYSSQCLICEDEADERAETKKRKEVRREISYLTEDGRDTLFRVAISQPTNVKARELERRLWYNDDLQKGGKYHQECYMKFCRPVPVTQRYQRGRPENQEMREVMEKMYNALENSDDCQFSLTDLLEELQATWMSHEFVKDKLLRR